MRASEETKKLQEENGREKELNCCINTPSDIAMGETRAHLVEGILCPDGIPVFVIIGDFV